MAGAVANVTLRLEKAVLRKARQAAVKQEKSLSRWVADLIHQSATSNDRYSQSRDRALRRLQRGFDLGGKPLSRQEIYER